MMEKPIIQEQMAPTAGPMDSSSSSSISSQQLKEMAAKLTSPAQKAALVQIKKTISQLMGVDIDQNFVIRPKVLENVPIGNMKAFSSAEILQYGQAILEVFKNVQRGQMPDNRVIRVLYEFLSPQAAVKAEKDELIATLFEPLEKVEGTSRNDLCKALISDEGRRKYLPFAVIEPEVLSTVRNHMRMLGLKELHFLLRKKFTRQGLKTPNAIYEHILSKASLASIGGWAEPRRCGVVPTDSRKRDVDLMAKISSLLSSTEKHRMQWSRRSSGITRYQGILSKLRRHRNRKSCRNILLARVASVKTECLAKQPEIVSIARNRADLARAQARSMASKMQVIEQRRAAQREREQKERLRLLRERDMDSYIALIKQTKNRRITDILEHTEKLLEDIGARIELEKTTTRSGKKKKGVTVRADAGAGDDSQVQMDEQPKAKYSIMSHKVNEGVKQPTSLVGGKLMDYQLQGLEFLVSLHNNNLSGILADEMGLGKTIQTIGFLAYLKEYKDIHGPHLVAVPLSTLPNWATEFQKWCPSLKVLCYRGNKFDRKALNNEVRKQRYNVLLTTFDYILRERKALYGPRYKFIIVDEGHRMKNVKSKFHSTLAEFKATHRLLLTGTPLQNNLNELWSLLHFLMPQTFSRADDFERWFEEPFKEQFGIEAKEELAMTEEEKLIVINRLHLVLRPFLLRRVKADVLKELPSKREYIVRIELSKWQKAVYEQLVHKCLRVRDQSSGRLTQKSVSNVIMQLRKVVNHPYLFLDKYFMDRNLWRCAGKFEVLDRMLPKLIRFHHKTLIFCQMTQVMDILGDYFDIQNIKYHRLDGSMNLTDRQARMDDFNDPKSDTMVFMLSTRAGGLGLNLQAADTVILFDSDWNPHQDLQAQARAHRVGQKNEVRVYRFVTISPVEELILAKAQFKLSIDEQIIQAGMFSNKYSEEERENKLRDLLSHRDTEKHIRVTTPTELNQFLARSEDEVEAFTQVDREMFGNAVFEQLTEADIDEFEDSSDVAESSVHGSGAAGAANSGGAPITSGCTTPTSEFAGGVSTVTHTLAGRGGDLLAKQVTAKVEELLIEAGRLISEDEIPQDIVLGVLPDDESTMDQPMELGPRKTKLRELHKQQEAASALSSPSAKSSAPSSRRRAAASKVKVEDDDDDDDDDDDNEVDQNKEEEIIKEDENDDDDLPPASAESSRGSRRSKRRIVAESAADDSATTKRRKRSSSEETTPIRVTRSATRSNAARHKK